MGGGVRNSAPSPGLIGLKLTKLTNVYNFVFRKDGIFQNQIEIGEDLFRCEKKKKNLIEKLSLTALLLGVFCFLWHSIYLNLFEFLCVKKK